MSTAATYSLLFSLSSCGFKEAHKNKNTLKIGVQSDLLSFDPLSFQSLGEKDVMDLLYGRALYFEGDILKSDFKTKVSLKKNKIIFKSLKKEDRKILKKIFKSGKKSTLWKTVFKDFKIKKNQILYLKKDNFISNLKSLMPLLRIDHDDYGEYKIKEHQKGVKVFLEQTKENKQEKSKFILIKKVKTLSAGLDLLSQKKIDVFLPAEPAQKNELRPYNDLDIVYSDENKQKLRLYYKHNKPTALSALFCKHQKEIKKVLEESWKLTYADCKQKDKSEAKHNNLVAVLSSNYGKQILDLLANFYQMNFGKNLDYFSYRGLRLSEVLKKGDFDHYLSLDVESGKTPHSYDSFHSKGRFNTLNIKDKLLDKILEEASRAQSLRVFIKLRGEAEVRLEKILPRVFEYSRPQIEFIKRKDQSLKVFKSSKRLMNFKKNPI